MPSPRYTAIFKGQYGDRGHPTFYLHTGGSMFWGDSGTANQFDGYPNSLPLGSTWMIFDWTVIDADNGGVVEWKVRDADWVMDLQSGAHKDGDFTVTADGNVAMSVGEFVRLLAAAAYGVQLSTASAAPTDANMTENSTTVFWVDQATNSLKARSRWSDGTYHTYEMGTGYGAISSVNTTPANGTATTASRSDHVHDIAAAVAGLKLTMSGGVMNWDGAAVQDEGIGQGDAVTLNFVGAGVTAAVAGSVATITVPAGAMSFDNPVESQFGDAMSAGVDTDAARADHVHDRHDDAILFWSTVSP